YQLVILFLYAYFLLIKPFFIINQLNLYSRHPVYFFFPEFITAKFHLVYSQSFFISFLSNLLILV
ncbi:MAG: hypothetical protein MJE63_14015, partial [Proteobacteria bacterium]|nr:hypothetical protein [Pseudomonadota bacterium]